jgi:hypothetical protein
MIKALFCILIIAGIYFCAVGFLDTADRVREAGASESSAHPKRIGEHR